MPRSSSAEPTPKQSKRKGTRSVSTLTPTQLARKRANDREAQRAIRARTKEHIERLERELADLKSSQNRDRTVQELLRRNKALEEELARLREHMGITVTSSPYSAPAVYDDNLSSGSGTVNSPRMSPLPSGDYAQLPEYGQTYGALSNGCETWASSVTNPVLSSVSSPSSPGNCDDYNATYIPTSVPATMMPAGPRVGGMDTKEIKMEYDELDNNGMLVFGLAVQLCHPCPRHMFNNKPTTSSTSITSTSTTNPHIRNNTRSLHTSEQTNGTCTPCSIRGSLISEVPAPHAYRDDAALQQISAAGGHRLFDHVANMSEAKPEDIQPANQQEHVLGATPRTDTNETNHF
ncbi:hypothetical protein PT974_03266 [Cladobotryum mycophilum]|uniref:BZIP domain-containing protein n=1 Tax=Cladobotryum mycophilum TaxID=491253 RepID=A0ABR0SS52_9HYPO